MPYSILIIGNGVVGQAISKSLRENGYSVDVKDKERTKTIYRNDAVIICVDTPTTDQGCDPSNVWDALNFVDEELGYTSVMIKSTITPDIAAKLPSNVVYSPEFLREDHAFKDFQSQPFMLLGGTPDECSWWKFIFNYLSPTTEMVELSREAASWCKYIHNTFLATKVVFFHELHKIAEELDCKSDFLSAIDITQKHNDKVGETHLRAPNKNGEYGYDGGCFPKDMKAFEHFSQSELIKKIMKYNDSFTK